LGKEFREQAKINTDSQSFYETLYSSNVVPSPKKMMLNYKSNHMKKLLGAWVLAAILVIPMSPSSRVQAQEKTELISDFELSLTEAIQLALANNPDINRALLATEDLTNLVRIAYSEIFPEITSSINYTRKFEIPVSFCLRIFSIPRRQKGF
jgi:hypothetical protein